MYLNDHKIALAAMAESVKDAEAIRELMSRAGIPVNNVTLVLIDSMRRSSFAAGREAMREDAAKASERRIDQWREMGALRAADAGDVILSIIRALPGKEGE